MDRRERSGSAVPALLSAFEGLQAGIWTTLPAVVTEVSGHPAFDPARRTVTLQLALQLQAQNPDGTFYWLTVQPLLDVPVVFPGGGGVTLTFPIKAGDEGLVLIASRCIDAWWQLGGHAPGSATPTPQVQMEFRMHDLSDGFFVPGLNSVPNVIPDISTSTMQLRSDDGSFFIELDPQYGGVTAQTPNLTVTGNVTCKGNVSVGSGATGTFVDAQGRVVTVQDGIVTNIV